MFVFALAEPGELQHFAGDGNAEHVRVVPLLDELESSELQYR